nr:F-box and FNIP repeat domain containing protein [Mimivirus sp.]
MSILDILNTDVIMYVMDYLGDYDKMNLMKTCREYYNLRDCIKYTNWYKYECIKNLHFIDKFKRLIHKGYYPNNNILSNKSIKEYTVKNTLDIIPNDIIHLKFEYDFNQSIKNYIPNNITHLTFGYKFNKSIKIVSPKV